MDPNMSGFNMPGAPPQLMNPPPQIFGSYGPDGQPIIPHMHSIDNMFSDNMTAEDANDSKRRRIGKACDMCRKKKIKCDGAPPACSHCVVYKTPCVYTHVEKKRAPPKGAKYIEGLENRLGRMEHLLRLSGLLDEDDNGSTDLGALEKKLEEQTRKNSTNVTSSPTSPSQPASGRDPNSTPTSPLLSPASGKDKDDKEETPAEEVEELSDMMCSLVTNHCGETRYIGSSSGFSIFSPKGIQWVSERTGDNSFQQTISEVSLDDHKWTNWKPEVFGDLFRRPIFRPLPPRGEAMSLLKDYFENFNIMFPLFHQPTFMHLAELQYSNQPYEGSGWWASFNCVLAIAHRLRVMSHLVPQEEDEKAWGHLKNAMGVFSELTMRNTDLLSVQALLAMSLFMQGTPNPQPTSLLIAAAIRLAHSIGLHKRGTGFRLNPIEIEQRKRVFWVAYILDKDLCIRSGRPPAQDDDDMNIELPDADPADNIGNIPLADGKGKMNLFRVMCELTVIESRVYNRLYSTKASKQSPGELLNHIGELDQQLEEWKDSIPLDFRPEHEIIASHTPLVLHIVMLHFNYYNCLSTIHRMSVHHGYWTSRLSNYALQGLNVRPLNPRIYSSAALCTAAARSSISLLKFMPQGDFSCVWLILYFPVSALVTLFGNILQNPMDPKAKSDTKLMNMVVEFLSTLGQEAEQGGVHRMLGVCSEFKRIAEVVIEKAEKEQSSRRKRKNADGASSTTAASIAAAHTPASNNSSTSTATASNDASTSFKTLNGGSVNAQMTPSIPTPASSQLATENVSPAQLDTAAAQSFNSMATTGAEASATMAPSSNWAQLYHVAPEGNYGAFGDISGFPSGLTSPPAGYGMSFQQPLLPQDLFSLPAGFDWNWAEMSGGAYPSVENGTLGDGEQQQQQQQFQQQQ